MDLQSPYYSDHVIDIFALYVMEIVTLENDRPLLAACACAMSKFL